MKNKSLFKIIFIFVIIGLTACLFALSLSTCDASDDETGQPFHAILLPVEITSPLLNAISSRLAIKFKLLQSNSAILYLELHETSPPAAAC